MLYILTAGQQLRDPAASGILFAKTQGCNNHWDTDEGAGDAPECCPRENRNENYERRNGQSHARDTWFQITTDDELDKIQDEKNRDRDLP